MPFFKSKDVVKFMNNDLKDSEFLNDLNSFIPTKTNASKYTIMETDDPQDLLLIGTEIRGSCQRVEGNPELNKCLLSYLMNGEIKAIAVKSGDKLVARSIIRLGWDPKTQRRVLLQERIYNNIAGNKEIEEAINRWAKDKAQEMGCPLVAADTSGDYPPYSGEVHFYKGFAPFTYSDASGGVHSSNFETKNAKVLYEPDQAAASSS
jgi:hypothetical protein